MKEFDLNAALNGEPFYASGQKCYIAREVTEFLDDKSSRRFVVIFPDSFTNAEIWDEHDLIDDIEMWEDPKLTSEQVLEKAYNEDSLVLCDGNPDLPLKVIAKTKSGEFVMQPEDDTIQPWLANLTMEWFFVKNLDPKFDTCTLPKPFKPKKDEEYFYLGCKTVYSKRYCDDFDHDLSEGGQCFRTEEDAQKWLDFMKSKLE
jgi:hypothetical protein